MSGDHDAAFFQQPPGTMPRITEIWAYLAVDPTDHNEGVIGMMTDLGWVPFVCADKARFDALLPIAKRVAREQRLTVRVAHFTNREDVLTFDGGEVSGSKPP